MNECSLPTFILVISFSEKSFIICEEDLNILLFLLDVSIRLPIVFQSLIVHNLLASNFIFLNNNKKNAEIYVPGFQVENV